MPRLRREMFEKSCTRGADCILHGQMERPNLSLDAIMHIWSQIPKFAGNFGGGGGGG